MFITDGGLQTVMIFREGLELPEFASFTLLQRAEGQAASRRYYEGFIEIAAAHSAGFSLDTPTCHASAGWGRKLGYSSAQIDDMNREAVSLAQEIRAQRAAGTPVAVCGTIDPRGTRTTLNGSSRRRRSSATTRPR
jgi:homocysteine S-methyltransferase